MTRGPLCCGFAALLALYLASPALASFPGRNGLIAYSTAADRAPQIYTMTAKGKDRTLLTREQGPSRNPAWSPDGERIAFEQYGNTMNRTSLYLINADGSGEESVPTGRLAAFDPSWSPNGRRLVFEGCKRGSKCEETGIYVVRLDGSGLKRIARNGVDPVWAPNGKWIAYYGKFARGDECETLIRVKPSGRGRRALLSRKRDSHNFCAAGGSGADFAPDSKRLVYYGLRVSEGETYPNPVGGTFKTWNLDPAVYTIGSNGKGRKLIATRKVKDQEFFLPPFAWSPDGEKLVRRDDRGVYTSNTSGGGSQRIARIGGEFSWQPLPRG